MKGEVNYNGEALGVPSTNPNVQIDGTSGSHEHSIPSVIFLPKCITKSNHEGISEKNKIEG